MRALGREQVTGSVSRHQAASILPASHAYITASAASILAASHTCITASACGPEPHPTRLWLLMQRRQRHGPAGGAQADWRAGGDQDGAPRLGVPGAAVQQVGCIPIHRAWVPTQACRRHAELLRCGTRQQLQLRSRRRSPQGRSYQHVLKCQPSICRWSVPCNGSSSDERSCEGLVGCWFGNTSVCGVYSSLQGAAQPPEAGGPPAHHRNSGGVPDQVHLQHLIQPMLASNWFYKQMQVASQQQPC